MPQFSRSRIRLLIIATLLELPGIDVRADAPPDDIVIVGAGISGLCAGLEAARAGANVTVADMASVFGGHAVMSSGMVCLIGTPEQDRSGVADSQELATRDFISLGEDSDARWAGRYAKESKREVYDWLAELGVKGWELFPLVIPGNSVRRQHVAPGRGVGLVSPIYRECLRYSNLRFVWNTRVSELIVESGKVAGVRGMNERTGEKQEFRAKAVVLATGGFESNLELIRANWPNYFPALSSGAKILLGSGINSMGSGLELAEGAGGTTARLDHQLFYSTGLVDPRDPSGRRGVHAFNTAAIWVNAQGQRFVRDGAPDPKTQIPAVLRQNPQSYWMVFDAASRERFFVSGSDFADTNVVRQQIFENRNLTRWVKEAESIEGLATSAALPLENLQETIRRWNGSVARGFDADFQRFNSTGDEKPIEKPPFFAVQMFPLARKSLGGVAVDSSCRVLDKRGQPIPGLYAVGELTGVGGINGQAALEGTLLGPSILMGRVAAKEIIPTLRQLLKPVAKEIAVPPASDRAATDPVTLRTFREVLGQLVNESRRGYFHFEKAHGVVLKRDYDCVRCHRTSSPLSLNAEQLDRTALIQACPLCHGGAKE